MIPERTSLVLRTRIEKKTFVIEPISTYSLRENDVAEFLRAVFDRDIRIRHTIDDAYVAYLPRHLTEVCSAITRCYTMPTNIV